MTATLNRPPGVRQPYYRRFAGRTALWTTLVVSGLAVAEYVALLLPGGTGVFVAAVSAGLVALLAYASLMERQWWAHGPLALLWVSAVAIGYARHGIGNTLLLAEAWAMGAVLVATVLALGDMRRRMAEGLQR